MTAVHSKILEWCMEDAAAAAAGCTGHLTAAVAEMEQGQHMAVEEGQSSGERRRVMLLHAAAAAAEDDGGGGGGCPGNSGHCW